MIFKCFAYISISFDPNDVLRLLSLTKTTTFVMMSLDKNFQKYQCFLSILLITH